MDGGDRAFQFVRQRMHQFLDIFLAFELVAHRFERAAKFADFVVAQCRQRGFVARFDSGGVILQLAQLAR